MSIGLYFIGSSNKAPDTTSGLFFENPPNPVKHL